MSGNRRRSLIPGSSAPRASPICALARASTGGDAVGGLPAKRWASAAPAWARPAAVTGSTRVDRDQFTIASLTASASGPTSSNPSSRARATPPRTLRTAAGSAGSKVAVPTAAPISRGPLMPYSESGWINRRSQRAARMLAPPNAHRSTTPSIGRPSRRASSASRRTRRNDAMPAVPSVTRMPLVSSNSAIGRRSERANRKARTSCSASWIPIEP